jgi:hypothetical protein
MSPISSASISSSYRNTVTLGGVLRGYPLLCFGGIAGGIMLTLPWLSPLLYSGSGLESSRLRLLSPRRNSFTEVKRKEVLPCGKASIHDSSSIDTSLYSPSYCPG